jgi:hypothetical protein
MEQQLQQSKDIEILIDIGILAEDYSSEWTSLFPKYVIPKKNEAARMSCH